MKKILFFKKLIFFKTSFYIAIFFGFVQLIYSERNCFCLEKEDRPTGAEETETNPYRRLHRLLRVLFSTTLSKTEKLDILEKEFGIVQGAYDASMIESLRKETDTMCNLSQAVKELGIEIGKKEGISQGIDIGRTEGIQIGESKAKRNLSLSLFEKGMSIDEIASLLGESISLVQEWLNGGRVAME